MILHWLIGDIFYFFNGMLFISAGLLIPWANPEADLGCRQMAPSRSGCAAADASDPSYFSSMAIRGSSLLPSLIVSGFIRILLLSFQNHTVKPNSQSNFEAENSSPRYSLCWERAETFSRELVASSCLRVTSSASMAVCKVNTNPSNTSWAKSLSPDQLPAPLLQKSWQIIPELQISGLGEKDIGSKTNWILQYFTNPPKYLITKPESDLDSFYPTPASLSQFNIKKQMAPICWK